MIGQRQDALAAWLARQAGARAAAITGLSRLSGGAIQQNWAVAVEFDGGPHTGKQDLVVRTDSSSAIPDSRSRGEEFAVYTVVHAGGVLVPEPLWMCPDAGIIGSPFFVMRKAPGIAAGHRLVKDAALVPKPTRLLEDLGRQLARIHAIRPPHVDLAFLDVPLLPPAQAEIAAHRAWLDGYWAPQPVLEWGLRWLERRVPPPCELALCHNDFRTGNYLVANGRLAAVLDWEFAGWGDPMADLGWFCAPCWRFGARSRAAGGIGAVDDLVRGYEAESGRTVDLEAIPYWIVMATVRWAVVALKQAERHRSGGERSLELALTAYVLPELELDILDMTREA